MQVRDLPEQKRLIQLAEESAELAKAALKLIRAMSGDTPVTENEARANLIEEIADVETAVSVIISDKDRGNIDAIKDMKMMRWIMRINRGNGDGMAELL